MKQMKKRKLNNKGFSLVELLIAVALLAIVSVAVSGFLSTVNRNYKRNQTEVDLQYESQTVMNQLKDLLIDTSKGLSVTGNGTNQIDIFIYNDTTYSHICWVQDQHAMYLRNYAYDEAPEAVLNRNNADLISEFVFELNVDLSEAGSRRQVAFTMTFAKKVDATQKYQSSNTITLRNNVLIGKTRQQVYNLP